MKPSLSTRSLEKIIDWCGKHPGHVYAEYFDNIAINLPEPPQEQSGPKPFGYWRQ